MPRRAQDWHLRLDRPDDFLARTSPQPNLHRDSGSPGLLPPLARFLHGRVNVILVAARLPHLPATVNHCRNIASVHKAARDGLQSAGSPLGRAFEVKDLVKLCSLPESMCLWDLLQNFLGQKGKLHEQWVRIAEHGRHHQD